MNSKKNTDLNVGKGEYEQFMNDVINNRKANEFRKATQELLKTGQIVFTMAIDPCTQSIIYTGDLSILEIIQKSSNNINIQDIERAMLSKKNNGKSSFTFSELHKNNRKDYKDDEPVSKLPKLRISPDSSSWTAITGRKVVENFMKDIKDRENLSYNKNKDKTPSWYPKDVKKLYASNLDKDESKKVMKAIIAEFPEIRDVYKVQKKRFEQTHRESPSKKLNLMNSLSLDNEHKNSKPKLSTNLNNSKINHDDLRKKLFFSKDLKLKPKSGWDIWVCQRKFKLANEIISKSMNNK